MGKSLFIVRHAQADWANPDSDFNRTLTNKGLSEAKTVADHLLTSGVIPEIWVSSPAKRALQTAKIFAKSLQIESNLIQTTAALYLGAVPVYLQTINQLDNQYNLAIIFGHNPGVSELVTYFIDTQYIDLATSTLVEIEFPDADHWKEISVGTGHLKKFIYPRHEYAR